jgi:quinoprotein glucose dehydrogenase
MTDMRRAGLSRRLLSLVALVWVPFVQLAAQSDWLDHGGDRGGSRSSTLAQIDRSNVASLEVAWTFRTGDGEGNATDAGFSGLQVTPIRLPADAGGALVLCSAHNEVIALDPATGRELWRFDPKVVRGRRGTQYKCRGVAQWHDTEAAADAPCTWRVLLATFDQRLYALDALTGKSCAGFGDLGLVRLAPLIKSTEPSADSKTVLTYMPPTIVRDTVVVGSSVGAKFRRADAPSGAVRAFDVRSGAFKWSFDPVPRNPGDPEAENWDEAALERTGGGNVWSLMSADEERDLVFLPTSSPSPNYFGGTRPGMNRYANSTVALRGSTGEVVWHFQIVHHDVWDWDLASQPLLVDIRRGQDIVPAVVQLTKHGLVFVFHRETGKPLFPVEERAVPTDGVDDDTLSPTQPFPTAPPPLSATGITPEDAWGFTFYDRGKCKEMLESYRTGVMFTPPSLQGTVMMPGMVSNWGSGAFDASRNLLITNPQNVPNLVRLIPSDAIDPDLAKSPMAGLPGGPAGIVAGTPYAVERGAQQLLSPFGAPCTKPPWQRLVAVDLDRGTIEWDVPLGTIDKLMPVPVGLKLGAPGIGGPIVTAGGLVFIGATADEKFRAIDIATGEELWQFNLPTSAMATPMTYAVDGRQYVVVAAGGHHAYYRDKVADYLYAFALPE